ncbi:LysR family transcriptional regulator [Paenarthrobacter aurescens]|uniref:LysR family transcriptional regulator n=1 Tax=Paenarthrobacter aurescens TaxID=43663 RepID=A0A4Y3N975_PAEAU|nr:LysR family transcriptional regulator [Paenarthrobacter aurescens]MDO6144582.1 LysR family transcriptional regulator [Paenarthrobacter aurescens]MDO6148427.1 LysR family transcriptional regulator [Paenarthrobacter aurescens]MDO6159673.1 LysR family transcriptional regulator [Paenarthrobacter aurescens]MDO6164575.1 LysR family transcriptional regulator [Paenarthrobacter aurescens]GEB17757.1 LysR family transcriptional regulator [Paenarthrobacter aurescens]
MRHSLDQVEAFVMSCKWGSFSAAARALGRSQSTISASVANLEIALGLELFDRSTRIPTLTAAGETMLVEALAVYDRCQALESHADAMSEGDPASLTIAAGIPHKNLVPVLCDFAEKFPHTDIIIRNPEKGDVANLVQRGEAALGVAFAQPRYVREIQFHQMGKLILTHVAHAEHPLAAKRTVSFDDLREHRHIVYTAHAASLPTTEYLQSTQVWSADNYDALIEMASAGLGWATLPRQLILDQIGSGQLVELQLEAYPYTDWLVSVDLLSLKGRRIGKAESWLLTRMQSHKIQELTRHGQPTTW